MQLYGRPYNVHSFVTILRVGSPIARTFESAISAIYWSMFIRIVTNCAVNVTNIHKRHCQNICSNASRVHNR